MPDRLIERLALLNTKECLWMYILRILSDKPAHAYSLRGEIERRFGFRPGAVTAYRVLYFLTSRGYVKNKADGRRKVYEITDAGKGELKKAVGFYSGQLKALS